MYSGLKCLAPRNFFRVGCAIYLAVQKSFPKFTRNSQCVWGWRNPTCVKCAAYRYLPWFKNSRLLSGRDFWSSKCWREEAAVGWSQVLKGKKQSTEKGWKCTSKVLKLQVFQTNRQNTKGTDDAFLWEHLQTQIHKGKNRPRNPQKWLQVTSKDSRKAGSEEIL